MNLNLQSRIRDTKRRIDGVYEYTSTTTVSTIEALEELKSHCQQLIDILQRTEREQIEQQTKRGRKSVRYLERRSPQYS